MKKFLKFLLCLAAVAAAIGGVLYFMKNVLMGDDYDDDDFDNDLWDEEDEDRDYVTINVPNREEEETEETTEPEEETIVDSDDTLVFDE